MRATTELTGQITPQMQLKKAHAGKMRAKNVIPGLVAAARCDP